MGGHRINSGQGVHRINGPRDSARRTEKRAQVRASDFLPGGPRYTKPTVTPGVAASAVGLGTGVSAAQVDPVPFSRLSDIPTDVGKGPVTAVDRAPILPSHLPEGALDANGQPYSWVTDRTRQMPTLPSEA